jgi:acetylglutamate kinase
MTRVIKVGGRAQADPLLASLLAHGTRGVPASTVVVHGGGDEVSSLQRALGSVPRFIDGRRVTTESDIDLVRMVLSGVANKRLVAALAAHGVRALGLSGEDGALLTARTTDDPRLGCVGAPDQVNVALLRLLMDAGYVAVISPVSRNAHRDGAPALNVNGDDAAAAIAIAVDAEELLFISDVQAVLDRETPLAQLSAESARDLCAAGTAHGGMRAKLHAALTALEAGVTRVRICDVSGLADQGSGTLITLDHAVV